MTRRSRLIGLALTAAGACAAGFTGDETPRGAIERANELYRSAKFSEAAEAYGKIET
ncbi:MAG: hypothetical protein IT450_21385, partial [Phycisphaerales bacterium]|nr:hypothetical protein [Phycisphaerales bacterium]